MKSIAWTDSANRSLTNLHAYIALDSREYADRFIEKIIQSVEMLHRFPLAGRQVPESEDQSIREILFQNYRIMYRVESENVLVLAVLHGGRDLSQASPKPWEIA